MAEIVVLARNLSGFWLEVAVWRYDESDEACAHLEPGEKTHWRQLGGWAERAWPFMEG